MKNITLYPLLKFSCRSITYISVTKDTVAKPFWIANLFLVTFVWGTTFVVIKQALNDISVGWFLFYRFLLATLVSLLIIGVYYFFFNKNRTFSVNVFNPKGWFLGLFLFTSYLCQTLGLDYTTPSNAAFITSLSVILVPFVLVLKGKHLKRLNIVSFTIATVGLALITIKFSTLQLNIGDIIVLGTAICLAIQIVYTDQFVKDTSPIDLTIAQLLCTTLLSFLFASIFEFKDFKMIQLYTNQVYFALILTALFATIYAFFVQTYAQQSVNPILIAIIFTFEPIFALLTSLWVGEETLTIIRTLGMMLILGATVLAIIQENRISYSQTNSTES